MLLNSIEPLGHPTAVARLVCALLMIGTLLGGCAVVSGDPHVRPTGRIIGDAWLEGKVTRAIRRSNDRLSRAHLRIEVHNGLALLMGQVSNAEDRELAGRTAAGVPKVRQVHNELLIGGSTSYLARANDRWLAGKVRSHLLLNAETRIPALRIVAENGTVYLLGQVDRERVEPAVTAARSVFGVQRVVKVFEYLLPVAADSPATLQP